MRGAITTILAAAGLLAGIADARPTVTSDVVYGHKDGMALIYDVFEPERANGAGIVYMVSGGWFSVWQNPERRAGYFQPLLNRGYTVFAVQHGSAPRFKVPDAVSDVRAAVRHIRDHAAEHGVEASRLGVWGGSAGGHLALMLGLDPEGRPDAATGEGFRRLGPHYAANADDDAHLAAVVAFYPPVDLRPLVGPNERFPALDFPETEAAAISPIRFVSADDPPVKLIHGDADELVPLRNSEAMAEALEEAGVEHDVMVIEGGDHGFRDPEHRRRAMAAMLDWFDAHLLAAE